MDNTRLHEDLNGYFIEDLSVGMSAAFAKTITEADIVMFSGVTGDMNPVHVNEDFARDTMFKGRIAHGMLTASLISTVLGMKMPGPGCIYLSQDLKFLAPVRAGDTVTAHAIITDIIPEKKRIVCKTTASIGEKIVCDGEAKMMVRSRAEEEASKG
ncbi:MaoC family dehydratase [Marivibrio halodurans]|uniref:MaoC family dehydratase n=1 Tax=Marivibrio halodurans TaxID=2039722 RepID=A0A8J7V1Z3_9PROT|nr:MaoC family dehydratase [Marivibrio halodurans]MBP5858301.1 MaoC family dehydratase [Marivibrio halodurans]